MSVTKGFRNWHVFSVFHDNNICVSFMAVHFRFAAFCRHLHLECMKSFSWRSFSNRVSRTWKKNLTYEAGLRELLEVPDFLMREFVWADVLSFSFRHSASRRCGMKEKCQKNRARRVNCIRDWGKFVCDVFSFPSAFFLSRNWRAFAAGNFNLHCHSTRKLSWNRR